METWQIVLIAVLSVFAAIVLSLVTAYVCYRIVFFSNRKKKNDAYFRKVMKHYGEYGERFDNLLKNLQDSECEKISINSRDGLLLSGKYYHKNDGGPLHILFHGYRSRAEYDMSGIAYECMSLSHNVLLVDQRAHGESSGKTISFGIKEREDLLSWCVYAKNRFGDGVKIFIWGVSMGAATVLMSLDLPLPDNVIGAVVDCPYSAPSGIINHVGKKIHAPMFLLFPFVRLGAMLFGSFRLGKISAENSLLKAEVPVLLIHGEKDGFVPCEMSEKMAKSAKNANVDLRFLKVENATHAMNYLENPEKYRKAVFEFIMEILERNK